MKLSYIIVTRNRREALLRTLSLLEQNTHLPRHAWEVFIVDNASDDGTVEAVTRNYRQATLIRLAENEGVPARNHAIKPSQGRFVVFLDDDSYPLDDAIPRSLAYMSRHPKTAALVARVILPDGSAEAPAMPAVTLGGASIIRREALEKVGGFAPEFFRQAEEYDFSLRVWNAGYRIERFEDIRFGHDKVAGGRTPALIRRMDLRNNLIVAERYLPKPMRRAYRYDWLRRYAALGLHEGHRDAINAAVREARIWAQREAQVGRRIASDAALEAVFQWKHQAKAVAEWSSANKIRRVAIADVSKNIYATWNACRLAGLEIAAVLENGEAFSGSSYRDIPVLSDTAGLGIGFDGIVLSNVNPAQIDRRKENAGDQRRLPHRCCTALGTEDSRRRRSPVASRSQAARSGTQYRKGEPTASGGLTESPVHPRMMRTRMTLLDTPTPRPPSSDPLSALEVNYLGAVLESLPARRKFAVDVGAHNGDVTAALADLGFKVLAVEPQDFIADRFARRHAGRMDCGQVQLVRCAASDRRGEADLIIGSASTISTLEPEWTSRCFPEEFRVRRQVRVPVRPSCGSTARARFRRRRFRQD